MMPTRLLASRSALFGSIAINIVLSFSSNNFMIWLAPGKPQAADFRVSLHLFLLRNLNLLPPRRTRTAASAIPTLTDGIPPSPSKAAFRVAAADNEKSRLQHNGKEEAADAIHFLLQGQAGVIKYQMVDGCISNEASMGLAIGVMQLQLIGLEIMYMVVFIKGTHHPLITGQSFPDLDKDKIEDESSDDGVEAKPH